MSAGVDESVLCCDELSSESEMPVNIHCALFEFIRQYSVKEIEKLIYNTLETIQNTATDQDRNDTKVQSRLCKLYIFLSTSVISFYNWLNPP